MRHPFSPFSLVAGLVLALVGAGSLLREHDVLDTGQLAVAGPVAVIALGVVGIALTLGRPGGRRQP